jgi:amidophosphoribosyltransferase
MCGIVGIFSKTQGVAHALYDSLIQLQHRGQDAAGILTCSTDVHTAMGTGLVRDIFTPESLNELDGHFGIGHVRYPTSGKKSSNETQPFWRSHPYGIGFAHNGNLTNQPELQAEFASRRRHLSTHSDSETLLHLFADTLNAHPGTDDYDLFFAQLCTAVQSVFDHAEGAYSNVATIMGKGLVAFRDPHGIRPLTMGKRGEHDYIFASETTPFSSLEFEPIGDVAPGEVVFIDTTGTLHRKRLVKKSFHPCIFEHVYFARPDSLLDDVSVYRARLRMGQNLAKQWQVKFGDLPVDAVIPVPFTSNTAALAFAHEIGVRYTEGLYKNPFIGRTFIMPDQAKRQRSVQYKLSPQRTEIEGKNILLVDDSIVRGTTSREIVRMIRKCGAKSVYFATTCPPVKFPCHYGINIPTFDELIANNKSIQEIQDYMGVDALLYESEASLVEAVLRRGEHKIDSPCMACLNGKYVTGCKKTNST